MGSWPIKQGNPYQDLLKQTRYIKTIAKLAKPETARKTHWSIIKRYLSN